MTGEAILPIWVVYSNPSDYPGKHVVRIQYAGVGGVRADQEPSAVVDTLIEARAAIPPGLVRFPRDRYDDVTIVESWL